MLRFVYLLGQILTSYNEQPDPIADFPDGPEDARANEALVKQCQWIYDQAEQRRNTLEQKAQSTFSLMVFLVPLLTSAFVYIVGKTAAGTLRTLVLVLVCTAAGFILLGFVSALRAVGVKTSQTLSLDAVLQFDGAFKTYEAANHAKGLLFCASMNTAMNDHLAQFVRGSHAMTGLAVLIMLVACIPEGLASVKAPTDVPQVRIAAPVEVRTNNAPVLTSSCGCMQCLGSTTQHTGQAARHRSGSASRTGAQ